MRSTGFAESSPQNRYQFVMTGGARVVQRGVPGRVAERCIGAGLEQKAGQLDPPGYRGRDERRGCRQLHGVSRIGRTRIVGVKRASIPFVAATLIRVGAVLEQKTRR